MASSSSDFRSDFLSAALSGNFSRFKKMVAKLDDGGEGTLAKIKDTTDGATALHLAATGGHTRICEYLIKQLKFDVDVPDKDGGTPLYYATGTQHIQTALYLMESGASLSSADNMGFTPLHVAAATGQKELLKLLISRGADIEASSGAGTPFTVAITLGNREVVETLLQNNANPNPVSGTSPVIIISCKTSLGCTDLLVKAGVDPDVNFFGVKPLHSAVSGGKVEIVQYLLKAGANPDALDFKGFTPLEIAACNENLKAMSILFPVITRIPEIPDWSIGGLIKHVNSIDAIIQVTIMTKQFAHMAKSKGEDAFNKEAYWEAINWYTTVIESGLPADAKFLSNRSLCFTRLNIGRRALDDAEACVMLRSDWPKAHYREGVAWKLLKNYKQAANFFARALKLDPSNKEVEKALREAIEAQAEAMGI